MGCIELFKPGEKSYEWSKMMSKLPYLVHEQHPRHKLGHPLVDVPVKCGGGGGARVRVSRGAWPIVVATAGAKQTPQEEGV